MNGVCDSWIKISITVLLSSIAMIGILGYFYISISGIYRNPQNRWWVGLLSIGLPIVTLFSGLIIWMLWNPLIIDVIVPLLILSLFVSVLLGQSITSPYKLADWWIEVGKWRQKRKQK
jgi:hypothetical protein